MLYWSYEGEGIQQTECRPEILRSELVYFCDRKEYCNTTVPAPELWQLETNLAQRLEIFKNPIVDILYQNNWKARPDTTWPPQYIKSLLIQNDSRESLFSRGVLVLGVSAELW